jgi:hypothetical protein
MLPTLTTPTPPAPSPPYPTPIGQVFQGCPPEGKRGDGALNFLKNRVDAAVGHTPVSLPWLSALPYPKAIARVPRAEWTIEEEVAVAQWEGMPISVEGYIVGDKHSGPESCNCGGAGGFDYHLYLAMDPGEPKALSVVCELGPRVVAQHPEWTPRIVAGLVATGRYVRLSGWLMMDQEHVDQVNVYRATPWEIHPVTVIEVWSRGQWRTPAPWWHPLRKFVKALVGK